MSCWIGVQLGEIAKASPGVAIGSDPFFDLQHGANTNVMLLARDAQKLVLAKREGACGEHNLRVILALSRRKQGFESPRERQQYQ
jgi:hypothetical protein